MTRIVRLLGHIDVFADDELITDSAGGGGGGCSNNEDLHQHQRCRHSFDMP